MKNISGITDQPRQQTTLVLADGSKAVWSLAYRRQQRGWFWDIAWGQVSIRGQRLVASPNILRRYINLVPFGISVVTESNVEPTTQDALASENTQMVLLEGADITDIETAAFAAPEAQLQPIGIVNGSPQIILPADWGPAGEDLSGNYPNPRVVGLHEGGGERLSFGVIPDTMFLQRQGNVIVGVPGGGGGTLAGDVVGAAGANTVQDITNLRQFTRRKVGYASGGNINLRFDLGSYDALALATNTSFSPGGSFGMVVGRQQVIDLTNAAGVDLTLTYNAAWKLLTPLPAVIPANTSMRLWFECTGTTEASISVWGSLLALTGDVIGNPFATVVKDITQLRQFTRTPIPYAGGGNIQLRFDLGAYAFISLATAPSFSPGGSAGMIAGRQQIIDLTNASGVLLAMTYNASWRPMNGTLPPTLGVGQNLRLHLECRDSTEGGISVSFYAAPSGLPNIVAPGTFGSSTRIPIISINAQGLVTALSDTAAAGGTGAAGVFSVADYGALPNVASSQLVGINACIAAAITFATGSPGRGATVYFPDGLWYVAGQITVAPATDNIQITVKGNGLSSRIVQLSAGVNTLVVDLSNGGSATRKGKGFVNNLSFQNDSGITSLTAVTMTHGLAAINQHLCGGSAVQDIWIVENDAQNGGFTDGIKLINMWAARVTNIFANGSPSTYTGGGAGSGGLITLAGGVNQIISNFYYEYFKYGVRMIPTDGIGGVGLVPQGVKVNKGVAVETLLMMDLQTNAGGAGTDGVSISDIQCDNGNTGNGGLFLKAKGGAAGGHLYLSNCEARSSGMLVTDAVIQLEDMSYVYGVNCQMIHNTGYPLRLQAPGGFGCTLCRFSNCFFDGHTILVDTSCTNNEINNTGLSSIVNNGGGTNRFLAGLF